MIRQIVPIILMTLLVSLPATGQSANERARSAAQALQDGALIVRLTSNHRKTEAYKEMLMNPDIKPGEKKRLTQLLEETETKTPDRNQSIIQIFKEEFKLCPVYFMYDTSSQQLLKGVRKGIFLNERLEIDPSVAIDHLPFLVLKIAFTDPSTTARAEAMILMDEKMEELRPPFPYAFSLNNAGFAFTYITSKDRQFEKHFRKRVIIMNKRLKKALPLLLKDDK